MDDEQPASGERRAINRPATTRSKNSGCIGCLITAGIILVLVVLIGVIGNLCGTDDAGDVPTGPTRVPTPEISKDEQCLREPGCAADNDDWLFDAGYDCGRQIENLAAYDYDWINSRVDRRFDQLMVQSDQKSILYLGDYVRFQNGFGAWQRMSYSCKYDPINQRVLDVAVQPY